MAHVHPGVVMDKDRGHFVIDPITRTIQNSSGKLTLIKNDHNSECFTFEIPRYIENHDMAECNVVEVHYINIDGSTREKNEKVYPIIADRDPDNKIISNDEYGIDPDNPDKLYCRWLISIDATTYAGTLNFALRFACVKDDSTVEYAWSTAIYSGIIIADTIYNSNTIVRPYDDILAQWWIKVQEQYTTLENSFRAQFEARLKEWNEIINAKEPVSIDSVTAASPVITDDKTVTSVTVTKTDGTTDSFDIEAQNGKDGEDGQDAEGLLGIELIDGILYTKTSDNSELEFSVNNNGELAINF